MNGVRLEVNPNNQVILKYGNYRLKDNFVYQPVPNRSIDELADKIENIVGEHDKYEADKPYYKWKKNARRASLDLIKKSQRAKKAECCRLNTPKSFTAKSGQKLRECGAAIDKHSGDPRFTHCITLTLPANHQDAYIALAAHSSYAINRLFQPIRRKYGDMCLWFFVWEYQKRGALHLHIALYHPDESEGLWLSQILIDQWHRILCDIGEMAATDMFCKMSKRASTIRSLHQHHAQPMRKNLGAYFSKYASKKESKQSWYCRKYPVSRFWGSCYALKDLIKRYSYDFSLYTDNERSIEIIVENILETILKADLSIAYEKSFDISKTYSNGYKLNIAQGEILSFYCPEDIFQAVLRDLQDSCSYF